MSAPRKKVSTTARFSSAHEMHSYLFNHLSNHVFSLNDFGRPECNTRQQFVWYLSALAKECKVHGDYLLKMGDDFGPPTVNGEWEGKDGYERIKVEVYE